MNVGFVPPHAVRVRHGLSSLKEEGGEEANTLFIDIALVDPNGEPFNQRTAAFDNLASFALFLQEIMEHARETWPEEFDKYWGPPPPGIGDRGVH